MRENVVDGANVCSQIEIGLEDMLEEKKQHRVHLQLIRRRSLNTQLNRMIYELFDNSIYSFLINVRIFFTPLIRH